MNVAHDMIISVLFCKYVCWKENIDRCIYTYMYVYEYVYR